MGAEPENVTIPWPLNGTYKIQLIGTADGTYTLNLTLFTNSSASVTQTFTGTIATGAIYEYTLNISGQTLSAKPNSTDDLKQLKTLINSLLSSVFDDRIMIASNLKKALLNKINEVILKVEAGNYTDAINKLLYDIRAKMDGDSTAKDWITDQTTQLKLCIIIDHIIESIKILQENN